MNKRGKYTTLNLEEKMKVLSRIEAGRSLKSVMDEFGISKSTFYDIKKNKKLILDFVLKQDMPLVGAEKRKRTTGAKYGDVDDAVYMWYQQKRSAGVPVRGVELQAAAERFAQCFGRTDFKASTGWLFRFRNRHAIGNRKEPEYDLQGLEVGDYREILEKCGELETRLDDDRVWLNGDEEKGSPPKTKGGITKEVVQKAGAEEQTAEFKLSAVRKRLDYLLDFVDATPEFQRSTEPDVFNHVNVTTSLHHPYFLGKPPKFHF
ncbi:tigger transposable element-derived protein 7 [Pontoporia blainvillei]|uniref:Tigger transposable element-derived protein 7 n=1 Tax=Pontoporia blainvillei TaxID=48723 RepID=A0ABX0S9W3_PONBL|nr:tigger transposable element-derived protein 7 [Pontoporia blainvillei]